VNNGGPWDAFDEVARAVAESRDESLQMELASKAAAELVPGCDDAAVVVIAAARKVEEIRAGLSGRLVIGQAQGLLMGWLDVDADQAFAYLRRRSMAENRKLVDVAADIVHTRERPRRVQ
jgi:AmiR/NasT family two-component response regulator